MKFKTEIKFFTENLLYFVNIFICEVRAELVVLLPVPNVLRN